ncbi:sensor histidine kinase [Aquicoccus sp. G2-2]|uniref:sensor histidine kinase n=1 Tax=Aquicoccus sp. G2-2 TaxID=3092120 RepID=UPI002ADF141F|nr:sensor histidine kinase [Aquicoccus sp. G2-2]MEA1115249.1 sensor histidine kinase [Aquicoccus sp. G2-2]
MTGQGRDGVALLSVSRLTVRLIIILSLAILPLGLVSMYQSWRVLTESQALSEANLLDRTRRAVRLERDMIEHTFGAAKALAGVVATLDADPQTCGAPFELIVKAEPTFSFAGYVNDEGKIMCASNGAAGSIAKTSFFRDMMETKGRSLHPASNVADEGRAVFSFAVPVQHNAVRGRVWIAVPIEDANRLLAEDSDMVDLVLFDKSGEVLATEQFSDDRRSVLPAQRQLADLPAPKGYTFNATNWSGEPRDFAIIPIVNDTIFALGSWQPSSDQFTMLSWRSLGLYLPALIWLTCIVVAVAGLHRMVIRHFDRIRQWMRRYADHRMDFENARLDGAPEELEAVAETFRTMTRRIAGQDQQREEDLKEKTVLLREVHHRVKNNLQVISSIMNMQARNAQSEEAVRLIRRLQDRVMALAAIHRHLYLSRKLSVMRADELLRDIVGNLVVISDTDPEGNPVKFSTHFDPVPITPEQSMPLSLILTEAATNAVKYCGSEKGGHCWIDIALQAREDGRVCLSVVNSCAPIVAAQSALAEPGLGIGLIEIFTAQLDGTLEHKRLEDRYELHMLFTPATLEDHDDEEAEDDSA